MAKPKTKKQARRLWIDALRSGKYKWGVGVLQPSPGHFCCLGVLCEIAIKHGVIADYRKNGGLLPDEVQDWVGLTQNDGTFGIIGPTRRELTTINDEAQRNPFKRIANLIEKEPEDLFTE